MCEVVWRVRRGTTLTLLVDLSGIECGIVLLCSGTRYARTYIPLSNCITKAKNINRSSTAPKQTYQNLCVLSVLCGSLCQKTALQTPKTLIVAALPLSKPSKTSIRTQ
jgi:hypothetical protein